MNTLMGFIYQDPADNGRHCEIWFGPVVSVTVGLYSFGQYVYREVELRS